MPPNILEGLTPAILNQLLRDGGHLSHGEVTALRVVSSFETPPSNIVKLTVEYAGDPQPDAPRQLFLKSPKPHKIDRGKQEIHFYTTLAPLMPDVPLVRCYGSGYDKAMATPYLLLDDVGKTHYMPSDDISHSAMRAMLNALARLHATWWNDPRLPELLPEPPETAFAREFEGNDHRLAEMLDRLGDQITPDHRRILEQFVQHGPDILIERATSSLPLTLCHPDGHPGNFLVPYQAGAEAYIVDWHQYRRWWGPQDVAVLIVRSRMREHRVAGGRRLLDHYYQRLLQLGVSNYSWEACLHDYRLGVLDYLSLPLAYRQWPPMLELIEEMMRLFHDIQGTELFQGFS